MVFVCKTFFKEMNILKLILFKHVTHVGENPRTGALSYRMCTRLNFPLGTSSAC